MTSLVFRQRACIKLYFVYNHQNSFCFPWLFKFSTHSGIYIIVWRIIVVVDKLLHHTNQLQGDVLDVDIGYVCFTETAEVTSQPVYAVVQKKPKDKPAEEKSSGDMESKTSAGEFYISFLKIMLFFFSIKFPSMQVHLHIK